MKRQTVIRLARYGILTTFVIILLATYRLYGFTFFWLDDFNNVYLIRREGFWQMVRHVFDPTSEFFRPLGMWVYWILYRTSGLYPLPYHLVSWTLHAVNVALLFLLLRQATRSHYAAGLATLFFAFRTNFGDIYWSFANIFQLLALTFVLIGLLLYMRFGYSLKETFVLCAVYVLAIRAEEHAVVLPGIWLAYELLVRRPGFRSSLKNVQWKQLLARFSILGVIMLWFAYFKVTSMRAADPRFPYYLDLSVLTFGRGYGWYFNALYQTQLRWGAWFIISVVLATGCAIAKNRWALFFLFFCFATLLPFVFLVNHRFELYWYMPFVGLAGMLATGFRFLQSVSLRWLHRKAAPVALSLVFVCIAAWQFAYEERRGRIAREYGEGLAEEYRGFFRDLRSLALGTTDPMIYYTAIPRHMDEGIMVCVTQFVLERMDVDAKIVAACPSEGMCLEFRERTLRRIH